jgi:bifunctional DNase/RNase
MDTEGEAVKVDPDAAEIGPANGDGSALEAVEATVVASDLDVVDPDAALPVARDDELEPLDDPATDVALAEPEAQAEELEVPETVTEAADEDQVEAPEEPVPGTAVTDLETDEADTAESDFVAEEWSDPIMTPPEMSQMLFVDVVLLLPATNPVVVLQEADPPYRELRIPVGGAEGIAIGYAARGLATPRPLTHELFAKTLEEFGLTLDVVRITAVRGTAFTAEMVVSGGLGARLIDCRPSDAIALALRQRLPVPIMAAPNVLTRAGTDPAGAN